MHGEAWAMVCFFQFNGVFFCVPWHHFFLQGTPSGHQMWQVKLPLTR